MNETSKKLDLFQILNKFSIKDANYYKSLSEDEKKQILPVLIMRWLSGTKSPGQIVFLNEFVNPYVFSLHKHKELLCHLMTVSTDGDPKRYTWLKSNNKKTTKPVSLTVVQQYFGYSLNKAVDALPLLTEHDVIAYAGELGFQLEEIAKIKKEFKGS